MWESEQPNKLVFSVEVIYMSQANEAQKDTDLFGEVIEQS